MTSLIAHLNGLRRGLSCATSCEALLAVAQVRFKEPRPGAVRRRTASMDRDYLGVPLDRTRWRSNALLGVDGPEGLHRSPPSAAGDTGLYLTSLKAGRFRVEWATVGIGNLRRESPSPGGMPCDPHSGGSPIAVAAVRIHGHF